MSARFHFAKRWGAELGEDGSARFRLWAPSVPELRLRLGGGRGDIPMQRSDGGWFEREIGGLGNGVEYCFVLPDGLAVPDPAARAQANDVHGPSRLVDPRFYAWRTASWRGRPWEEAIIYELHVGAFSAQRTFAGVEGRLDRLAGLGVTAIELMPVAQFAGSRGWGYDGVLPYCPHSAYGGVNGLKRLIDAAHEREIMVLLDVVYNHFGPEGNYIARYAPEFFDERQHTPWGQAISFEAEAVRQFFIDNPLYWIEEYRLDGLRFDAIDQIDDRSPVSILEEMAATVRARFRDRHVHLTTEDERNIIDLHRRDEEGRPRLFTAEWNDDVHHALHALTTSEDEGYYRDFAAEPAAHAARALSEGFAFQGETYTPWKRRPRGVPSAGQPPKAFIDFLQNHDQIGNRAFGDRLTTLADARTVEILAAVLLLNPQVPLLFMGEEYGETRPFLFFTDFARPLADAVREGRRHEFAALAAFADEKRRRLIPDPNAPSTFEASCLDWAALDRPAGRSRMQLVQRLVELRRDHIVPWLGAMRQMSGVASKLASRAFEVEWTLGEERRLRMSVNLETQPVKAGLSADNFAAIHEMPEGSFDAYRDGSLQERSVVVLMNDA